MSQASDYTVDNSTGANVRIDLNAIFGAIATNNSAGSDNGSIQNLGFFADTSLQKLRLKEATGNNFVNLRGFDGSLPLPDGTVSSPSLFFNDDINTGLFSSATDKLNIATGGVERVEFGTTTIFNEDGADVDFRIEGDTDANLFYVDAGNNRVGIGDPNPDGLLHIGTGDNTDGTDVDIIIGGSSVNARQAKIRKKIQSDDRALEIYPGTGSSPEEIRIFRDDTNETMRFGASGEIYLGTVNWPTGSMGKAAGRVLIGDGGDLTLWNETNSAGGGASFKLACKEGGDAAKIGFCQMFGGTVNTSDQTGFLNIKISDASGGGNTKVRIDGDGLKFNSDTAAANALDDYEEGTFTPTNTIGLTLTNNTTAHYTKVGRVVFIQIDCTFSGSADSSICGIIQGLPFTSKSGCINEGALQFYSNESDAKLDASDDNTRIFIGASESRIDIQNITSGNFQTRAFMVGRRFRIQMNYLTA
tara:strand:+ start:36 stop:1454 length:1419 start_codon:yes stop_codon:yes gene_type:complete